MKFWQMSDGIPLYYQPHDLDGYDGQNGHGAAWLDPSPNSAIDTGNNSYGDGGYSVFPGTKVLPPGAIWNSLEPGRQGIHDKADGELSEKFHPDQHAVQNADIGSNGGSIHSGANEAGNGGNGYSYGGIIHASFILYQPINIAVAIGYGSSAHAEQTNDVHIDQSAVQIAGVGGNGGNGNIASGGSVDGSSSGADVIATGGNSAGNGGAGSFFGSLVNAPVVIYNPINIAIARGGGTAEATQSNTVEIDQSAVQIAGVGGNGGNGNAAIGGNVTLPGDTSGSSSSGLESGGSQAGNGGDGTFYGGAVHASFVLYNPINVAIAGFNSNAYALQANNVHLDQSSFQMAGIGGDGGNGNIVLGGNVFSGLGGGSDAIATGGNAAGNGGSGHFAGSLTDINVAIYAPINIAIAGPHSTAYADQVNYLNLDQSSVQIAGIGGYGGDHNLAWGSDVAMHLLSDLHLIG